MRRSVIEVSFSLMALTVSATAFAQAADTTPTASAQAQVRQEWVARYNGPGNSADVARALAVDGQGNVYVTGTSEGSRTGADYATLKYDRTGKLLWARRYNGSGNSADVAHALAVDWQGNVYVTGDSGGDYATLKYDPTGKLLWARRYNGPANSYDEARALAVDWQGNVYVTGSICTLLNPDRIPDRICVNRDYATLKYDPTGKLLWARRYNGPANSYDEARALVVDGRGGVYVTGAGGGFATLKYGTNGRLLWAQRYNSGRDYIDSAQAIAVDRRGNVYVTGSSKPGMRPCEDCPAYYATLKYDPTGKLLWVQYYQGYFGLAYSTASDLAVDGQGNVYVTGSSSRFDMLRTGYTTIKYDPNGNLLWEQTYDEGAQPNLPDRRNFASALALDKWGNVYVTGASLGSGTDVGYATVKYNPNGKLLWAQRYNGPGNSSDSPYALAIDKQGSVYVTGRSGGDYATIKYSQGHGQQNPK